MIWPFKKKDIPKTFEDVVQDLPTPLCNNAFEHYTYYYNGAPCRLCSEIRERQKKNEEMEALADNIAQRVVEKNRMMMESTNIRVWWEAQNSTWEQGELQWVNSSSFGKLFETAEEAFAFNRKRKETTLDGDSVQWRVVKIIQFEEYILQE